MNLPSPVQIILALVALALMAHAIARFVRRERGNNIVKLVGSLVLWGAVVTFALFPLVPRQITQTLGLGTNLNTLIFAGFVEVFLLIARLTGAVERLDRTITEIVRHEALGKVRAQKQRSKPLS